MGTPPASTLSTPSPTELHDSDPIAAELEKTEMLKSATQRKLSPIFLVVATTPCTSTSHSGERLRRLGIGLNGKLPWPSVKADMQYFKNVTQSGPRITALGQPDPTAEPLTSVIMGRKTYFSIPPRFRPLEKRENVIISRSDPHEMAVKVKDDFRFLQKQASAALEKKFGQNWREATEETSTSTTSIDQKRLSIVQAEVKVSPVSVNAVMVSAADAVIPNVIITNSIQTALNQLAGQISCIGGAEIYNAFLTDEDLRPNLRILQTEIQKLETGAEFECDTFWGEDLNDTTGDWIEASQEETVSWTGIELPQGSDDWLDDSTAGVRLRVRGWQHRSAS